MALVEMKCPNCGAPMKGEGSCFVCSHCGTSVLNVIDAKIDSDVTVISAEEFAAKLEEGKKSFVINVNDRLEEFDVDTMVINKKIKDAGVALECGEYDNVEKLLSGVPRDKYFAVERLIYLASKCAKNEFALTGCCGDIREGKWDIWTGNEKVTRYDRMIALADAETKRTYEQIRKYCLEKWKVRTEINEINKLFDVKLFDEAVTYAKKMCQTYPQAAYAWKMLYEAKRKVSPGYAGVDEFEKAKKCPDYLGNPINGTEEAEKRVRDTREKNKAAKKKNTSIAIAAAFLFVIPAAVVIKILTALYQAKGPNEQILYIMFCVALGAIACAPTIWYVASKAKNGEIERKRDFTQANYIEVFFDKI